MKHYLSADCGGTKTAFLLCNEYGEEEASCVLGPANYIVNGLDNVLSVLEEGIRTVCIKAGIRESGITGAFAAVAGLAISRKICRGFPAL